MRLVIPPMELARRMVRTAIGMAVFAFGNYLTVLAGVGQAPWNVLCDGLSQHLPLSYGTATMLVSFAILAADLALGEPIGLATLMDAAMIGPLFDVFNAMGLVSKPAHAWLGLALMTAGMTLLAVGQRIYMPAQFSCGPRAALTVGLGKRLRKLPVGAVEILIQVGACFAGWLLGGSVGVGTLWFAFGNGIVMQTVFRVTRFEPRDMRHLGIHQLLAR